METTKYLILDDLKENQPFQATSQIVNFFINQLDMKVYLITKENIKKQTKHFADIDKSKIDKLGLISAVDSDILLKKLAFFDNLSADDIPQVLIIDSFVRHFIIFLDVIDTRAFSESSSDSASCLTPVISLVLIRFNFFQLNFFSILGLKKKNRRIFNNIRQ